MLDWLWNWFKPKAKDHRFLDVTTVTTEERIDIEHKISGDTYSFYVATSSDGKWYAITDETQTPKFCLVADDRDEAYTRGVDALNSYFTHLDAKAFNDHS